MLLDPERLMQISLGIAAVAFLAGLILLGWIWWRRRQLGAAAAPKPQQPKPAPQPARATRLLTRMKRLHRDVSRDRNYRDGGHQLARLLRTELSDRLPTTVPLALTAEQLGHHTDADVARLARKLRTARFARRPPNQHKFTELCEDTLQLLEGEKAVNAFQKAVGGGDAPTEEAESKPKKKRRGRKKGGRRSAS